MKRKLFEEAQRRLTYRPFTLEDYCFKEQLNFVLDPSRFKTAVCSRRAGKTMACAADLLHTALKGPYHNTAYITLTRTSAKRIIWPAIKELLKKYNIKHKIDNTELTIELETGSTIYVGGAKDMNEVEKFRGISLKKVYVDEAQSFRDYILETLIDDVLAYATMDVNGAVCMIGTPGPVPAGMFFKASHNPTWANHKWTILNNPWIKIKSGKSPEELLAEERKRAGIDETNPKYMREALGLWVVDLDSLVYHFNPEINTVLEMPTEKMDYVFGIDIGFNDADAIAVLGYRPHDPRIYLVEEFVKSKQDITQLVHQIERLRDKYNPTSMVMDAGALGKKIQAELQSRFSLPITAADKTRKFEYIELLNDDLRNGRFQALPGSQFEDDSYKLEWEVRIGDKPRVSDRFHSDISDAILYGWKQCRHYGASPRQTSPARGTDEYMDLMEQKLMDEFERKKTATGLESDQDDMESLWQDND
jgi:hypothetical protein